MTQKDLLERWKKRAEMKRAIARVSKTQRESFINFSAANAIDQCIEELEMMDNYLDEIKNKKNKRS